MSIKNLIVNFPVDTGLFLLVKISNVLVKILNSHVNVFVVLFRYKLAVNKIKGWIYMNKTIDDILNYLVENMGDKNLSLSGIAKVFFLNPSYFSRMFLKEAGINFKEYLIKIRIEKAVKLLRETEMKAYEIAEAIGIPDSNYFSTCFKKYMGLSVSEYKKSNSEFPC